MSERITDALARLRERNLEIGSFINIGSGRGDDLEFFRRLWPQMQTLLIDMDPRFVEGWKDLARQYPGTKYIVAGAAAENGEGHFSKSNDVGGAISRSPHAENSHSTPLRKVDTLVDHFNLPGPYFMKFDTHGVELDIFKGAHETLQDTQLIIIEAYNFKLEFVDRNNLTFDEMCLYMREHGFRCVDFCEPLYRPGDLTLWQIHLVFIRDDHPVFQKNSYA
ncbi:FkbM family methyltransferase [Henriciella marina]|uniref:FkbM family methyltransferase n=1 Tax=Henriciella marina TaxID=453851 RepID=UPI00037F12D7|nr:FkbM family methyltransferase [Henriciella marina]